MANTIQSILEAIKTYVDEAKIANPNYTPSKDEITGLVVKIAKMWHVEQNFNDKLGLFDAEKMGFGGVIEEWQSMLANVEDFDMNTSSVLTPRYLKYLPPSYSYLQDKKKIPVTKPNDIIQKACLNGDSYASLIADIAKRLEDTYAIWKYGSKRELIGKAITAVDTAMGTTTTFSQASAYTAPAYVKDASNNVYVITQNITAGENKAIADQVKAGKAVKLDLRTVIGKPEDTETGEAFIKQIKKDVEVAQDINEGHSFNGGALGSETGMTLFIKQGIMPSLDVDTLAGAFNQERLAMPVNIVVLPDFGDANEKAYAVMADNRMFRRFPHYESTEEFRDASLDAVTYYRHFQDLYAYSRNAYIHVYEIA